MFINEFVNLRKECLFCGGKMVTSLEKLSPVSSIHKVLNINNKYKNDCFEFRSLSNNPPVIANIDGITHNVTFNYSSTKDKVIDITKAMLSAAFNSYYPHVQVSCDNKKCDTNYYYISTDLTIINEMIASINLSWESFNYKNSWIQNDWITKKTKIFSTENPEISPIEIDLIPFDSVDSDKFYNRIKTIITFS